MQISQKRFNQILSEEIDRFQKIKNLEMDKEKIIQSLQELGDSDSDDLDELRGGLRNLWKAGANKIKSSLGNIGKNIANTTQGIQKAYNQGEQQAAQQRAQAQAKAAKAKAQAEITQVWNQIKITNSQMAQLQNSYNALTGKYKNLTGKDFNPKAVAGPAKAAASAQAAAPVAPAQPAQPAKLANAAQ